MMMIAEVDHNNPSKLVEKVMEVGGRYIGCRVSKRLSTQNGKCDPGSKPAWVSAHFDIILLRMSSKSGLGLGLRFIRKRDTHICIELATLYKVT